MTRLVSQASRLQVGRYQWCPGKGNGTRYDLLFGMVQPGVYGGQMGLTESDEDESLYCLTWLERSGSGGGTIVFSNPSRLDPVDLLWGRVHTPPLRKKPCRYVALSCDLSCLRLYDTIIESSPEKVRFEHQ